MHKISKIVLFLSLQIVSVLAYAHDPNIATFQLRKMTEKIWIYEVMTPLSNLDRSLGQSTEKTPEKKLSDIEYKSKVVAHIKEGFHLYATGFDDNGKSVVKTQLSLGKGRIKLNQHMTVLKFEVKGIPETMTKLDFKIDNMTNKGLAQNVFRIISDENQYRYFLNQENKYSGIANELFKNTPSTESKKIAPEIKTH